MKRTGWILKNINDCETISGHMYNMAMMTFLLNDYETDGKKLDRLRCMEIALIHDVGESIIGDITPHCGVSKEEKHRIEDAAVKKISSLMGKHNQEYVKALFDEYENASTEEAKFVKQLDKFDLIFQAFQYEKQLQNKSINFDEFFETTKDAFTHPFLCQLVKHLYELRNSFFKM